MKNVFKTEKENYIGTFIDPYMIEMWLVEQATVWELYFLANARGMEDVKFSEYQDVFMAIAEHF